MITNLIVGDWSDDGHGKTYTVAVEHNLTSNAVLAEAYRQGCLQLGIIRPRGSWDQTKKQGDPDRYSVQNVVIEDVMEEVAESYENSSVPTDIAEALEAAGIRAYREGDTEFDGELFSFDGGEYSVDTPDGFGRMWMRIAQLGNRYLEFKIVKDESINIGGYGLFY